ncbi:hypothetical protein [Novosphingobium album (ex Hu et al. 2023)]|uniref:DUF2501 domain-containing protein n=1 Tax=Novosphingobium album (ex Hu et al. 2023) TaxID=2930093 RepID=A0ABT0B0Z0_9SPHN|nr:hypothetical protein [Novosphingobium album (ex Hu et al. 2023)]MCJ2178588.1 hypothetical protein [Novosphingobium album (ex Hu et al. 2023)]
MGKLGIGLASLVVGVLAGALGGVSLGGGAMAGMGVATGMSAGICSTMQAAQQLGFLTAKQVDQVLNKASQDLAGKEELQPDEKAIGSAVACAQFMEKYAK